MPDTEIIFALHGLLSTILCHGHTVVTPLPFSEAIIAQIVGKRPDPYEYADALRSHVGSAYTADATLPCRLGQGVLFNLNLVQLQYLPSANSRPRPRCWGIIYPLQTWGRQGRLQPRRPIPGSSRLDPHQCFHRLQV